MTENYNDEWWRDKSFWEDFAPLMFDNERLDSAREETEGIIRLSGAQAPQKILDVGCGPGRHALQFALRGYKVTGVDIQESYLADARKKTEQLSEPPVFINCDMRTFQSEEQFDGAVSLFQSLGYFENTEEDLAVCRNVFNSLKPGGWFLLEMDGKEALAGNFEERNWFERSGKLILLEYAVEGAWDRLWNHWRYRDEKGRWYECNFSYRLYSAVELGMLLEQAGFSSVEFFGSFSGRPYDHTAEKLVALARKLT